MNIFFILRKSYCFYQKKLITQTFQSANISTCQYWTSVESLHLAKFKVLPSFQTFYEYFKRFAVRLWKNSLPWNSLASSTSPSLSSTPDYSNDTTNNFKLINTWLGTVFPTTFKNTFEIWFFFQIFVKADECFELLLHIFCKHCHSMKWTPLHTLCVNKTQVSTSTWRHPSLLGNVWTIANNAHGAIHLSQIWAFINISQGCNRHTADEQLHIRQSLICCLFIIKLSSSWF